MHGRTHNSAASHKDCIEDRSLALFDSGPESEDVRQHVQDKIATAIQQVGQRMAVTLRLGSATGDSTLAGDAAALLSSHCVPAEGRDVDSYVEALLSAVVPGSINMRSPRCLAHMAGVVPWVMRPLMDLVLGLNQNLVKTEASSVVAEIERQTASMLHHLVYDRDDSFYQAHTHHPNSKLGLAVSGGTLANLTALWYARNTLHLNGSGKEAVAQRGIGRALARTGGQAVVLGSRLAHYSIEKSLDVLGLGSDSFIPLPVDEQQAVDLAALEVQLRLFQGRGVPVIALIGVAGSTDCGGIDRLDGMADLAEQFGIHFHVDAAWGGPLLFSRQHRAKLKGIERADTVTLDGHKEFHLPVSQSMLLFQEPHAAQVLEKAAQYMFYTGSNDPGRVALEGSRSACVLLWHAALHLIGSAGYEQLVDTKIELAMRLAHLIEQSDEFELLLQPVTNIVLYRYVPDVYRRSAVPLDEHANESINEFNQRLQRCQFEAGRTLVSRTTIESCPAYPGQDIAALRAILANPKTQNADLVAVLADQVQIALELSTRAGPLRG